MTTQPNSRFVIYVIVGVLSVLLSAYKTLSLDIINGDGILYINVARTFLESGFAAAADDYTWPFYSILIGLLHKIFGIRFDYAAYYLNAVFLAVCCIMFVRIYEEITAGKGRLWVAALLILSLPVLNDYRDMVIRGHGFWAFLLVALYYFIQYSRSPGLQNALKWQLAITVAILFRLEGIAFLVFAPLCLLFMTEARRKIVTHIFRLNSLFILLAVAGVLVLLASGRMVLPTSMEIPHQIGYFSPLGVLSALNTEAEAMFARNPNMSVVADARLILASGLLTLVFVKVASNIGLTFLAVWGYGVHRKWLRLTRESWIVAYFAAIGFLVLVPVTEKYFFLSSRYTVLIVLLVSLIIFQYADYLLRELSSRQLHKWHIAVWVIILALFLDGVISGGASKKNIRVAGEWVKAELAVEERIACNEARLEFYSDNRCKWIVPGDAGPVDVINGLKKDGYTYLLFWVGRKDEQLRSAVEGDPALVFIKEFLNRKGSSVRLYRVIQGRQ